MNKTEALEFLSRIAQGIAVMFGPSCETLVHDMSVPNHPILVIYNGHVSKRAVGSTVDILGFKVDADTTVYKGQDFVNHLVVTPSGQRIKSSTFHMFGDDYHYALGINFDFTSLASIDNFLTGFISVGSELQSAISQVRESHLNDVFDECISVLDKPVEKLNKAERLKLISLLNQKNAFSFQKSVPFVADKLKISRYTVYKYINEVAQGESK